jgi:hypothetical protein
MISSLSEALDDAHVTIGAVSEGEKCLLVGGAVVRGKGLRDTVKLNEDGALGQPSFVNARGHPTRQDAAACTLERRPSQLAIGGQGL